VIFVTGFVATIAPRDLSAVSAQSSALSVRAWIL
jgi:hypothetical protein